MGAAWQPDEWPLPPVIFYVNAGSSPSERSDFARQLGAMSHRARLDGVEARMTLVGDPAAPRVDDVCPGLAWMVGRAREAPMPRLLYVAGIADLAPDRRGLLATLDDLLAADVAVRACSDLLTAAGPGLAAFRVPSTPAPASAPAQAAAAAVRTAVPSTAAPAIGVAGPPRGPAGRTPARAAAPAGVVR